jgi:hypothetical protein
VAAHINLTPVSARAPRGARAIGTVPRNTTKTTTLIASMTTQRMGPAMLVTGATDTAVVDAYGAQVLAPALFPGQVVVLHNLSAHTRACAGGDRGAWLYQLGCAGVLARPGAHPRSIVEAQSRTWAGGGTDASSRTPSYRGST